MKKKCPSVAEEFVSFIVDVLSFDQRSAVIVIVARLDELLYRVIKKLTFPSLRRDDELLDGDSAPLSSLSSKITFVHRLGKVDSDLAKALHLIRKIRNDFAHKPDAGALHLSPHADRIREIVGYYKDYAHEYTEYRYRFSQALRIDESLVVQDFFTICGIVVQTIMEAARRSEHWRSKDVPRMTLIPEEWLSQRSLDKLWARCTSGKPYQTSQRNAHLSAHLDKRVRYPTRPAW